VSKEQVTTALLLAVKIYCCFCSVVNNHGTRCVQTHCKCMCYWRVPCNRLNSTVISEMVLCQSSLTISGTLSSSSLTQPVEVWHEHSQSSTKVSSCLNLENRSKVFSLHMALLLKAMHFWCSFPSFEAQLNGETMFFFSNQPSENHSSHLLCITINTWWDAMQKVVTAKLTILTEKTEKLSHPKAGAVQLPF